MKQLPWPDNSGTVKGEAHVSALSPHWTETPPGVEGDDDRGPADYWHVFRRHRGVLVVVAFVGLAGAVLVTLPQTPVYQARSTLEIRNLNENFLNMRDVNPTSEAGGSYQPEYDLATQTRILQSASVLRGVIRKLHLADKLLAESDRSPFSGLQRALHISKQPRPLTDDDALPLVTRNLKIRAQPRTRLIEVSYDSPDPALAADVVNALTEEFLRQNLESRWNTLQQTGAWLTRQMEDVRIKLEKSDEQLQDYARTTGLLFTADKDSIAEEKLRQLQQELSKAHADRVVRQSTYELATAGPPDSIPEAADDAALREYQVKLTELGRQLADLSSSLTPAHPAVKKVQAQLAIVQGALEKERDSLVRRIQNEFESAVRREKLLAASYETQTRLVAEQAAKVTHYNLLKREVDNNRQLYDSIMQHVKEAGIASTLKAANASVIDAAMPPRRPYRPNLMLNAALGLLAGIFAGCVAAVLRERADRSIQSPGETKLYLGIDELGIVETCSAVRKLESGSSTSPRGIPQTWSLAPIVEPAHDRLPANRGALLANQQSLPAIVDCFRNIITSILISGKQEGAPRVLVVTSACPGEGKTMIASNLAIRLAEINMQVLLIDGDLRNAQLHRMFHVDNQVGLSDLLSQPPHVSATRFVQETAIPRVCVMPCGSMGNADLLYSPRMADLIRSTRETFDVVLIDTPPVLTFPDARIMARHANGVLFVVRAERTPRDAVILACQRLIEDENTILGTILNDFDPRNTRDYKAYKYYGYRKYCHSSK